MIWVETPIFTYICQKIKQIGSYGYWSSFFLAAFSQDVRTHKTHFVYHPSII